MVCEWVRETVGIRGRSEVITTRAREAARGSKLRVEVRDKISH